MWTDNETDIDYLNFSGVAQTVAELIVQANSRPVSIGVSGAWGVGKTSMIQLVQAELQARQSDDKKFVFVSFNAWLYQGYDDARAALMEKIGEVLAKEAANNETALEKTMAFLKRVKWSRLAKLTAAVAATAAGFPPLAIAATALVAGKSLVAGEAAAEQVDKLEEAATKIGSTAGILLDPAETYSPPHEIDALRESFKEILADLKITLVVLIDDLDRCLPETTISTLEAIKLFLFLDRTAFVIAADDQMIKHAVRRHFAGIDDELVTNYFDKLIQIPIRVPSLSTQDVRAYMMLLHIENSTMDAGAKERIRKATMVQLRDSWRGKRINLAFIQGLGEPLVPELVSRLESADRLASIMATAPRIQGNPRLIKRFLNSLAIRMTIAKLNGVSVDEAALTKILLLERCAPPKAYSEIALDVMRSADGKADLLQTHENAVKAGKAAELPVPWNDPFAVDWLALAPQLAGHDLRSILYVSREHTPLVSPEDRLSPEGAMVLAALLEHPDMGMALKDQLSGLTATESTTVMQKLLSQARKEQEWGVPKILTACLAVADAVSAQGKSLEGFLMDLPPAQITPSIVPKISGRDWTRSVYEKWQKSEVGKLVKNAITAELAKSK